MKISLAPSQMYGHWTHCEPRVCEFQHGTTMIYVSYDDHASMESRLEIAQKTISAAFDEVGHVLAFATRIAVERDQDFWKNANQISLRQSLLSVFSIRYPLESDLPIYEVSWNPRFQVESAIVLSEDWTEEMIEVDLPDNNDFIYVKRLGTLKYEEVI